MASIREHYTIDTAELDGLLAAHDGDVALLYLHLLRSGGDREQAARALCRTRREIDTAWEKLERMGLLPGAPAEVKPVSPAPAPEKSSALPAPAPAEELPQYSAEEISRLDQSDPGFSAVLQEAALVMGRELSGNDMRVLCGVYAHLALPPEVILELLNYVGEVYRSKFGDSRRPSARAIEKEAYTWANLELLTLERAEDYLRRRRARQSDLGRLQARLGLQGRELSPSERRYLESWLDLGFGEDVIAIAHDRTVTNTGALKWPYMNKILLSWHEKGLRSPEEIEAKDGRRPVSKAKRSAPAMSIDQLREALKNI